MTDTAFRLPSIIMPGHRHPLADHAARADVEIGELGYWPVGHAFCIFFGPTPVSTGPEPRAYSPVTILGRVRGDATRLRDVRDGATVRVVRPA
ncbi:MAG: hypothetical protein CVU38_04200 [Chloroflexi bacterium HGW-Chloroflexi-1]|nr:MAG: hypothetical protein CVU38_04200 [Chloroflexi bacterium HGW-Chloroflexi-1]